MNIKVDGLTKSYGPQKAVNDISFEVKTGEILGFLGPNGAGKTTLVRGLLRSLGYAGRVKSPTYTLVEPYDVWSLHFYHFDFYRFEDRSEWLSSGFREYFNSHAFCVVEWPEKAGGLLAAPDKEEAKRIGAGDAKGDKVQDETVPSPMTLNLHLRRRVHDALGHAIDRREIEAFATTSLLAGGP